MNVVSGDPASCSALAGRLRRQAETLRERRHALWQSAVAAQAWATPAARAIVDQVSEQLLVVDRLVGHLDELGAALQAYSSELGEARRLGSSAGDYLLAHGLQLDSAGTVQPVRGPVPLEVAWSRRAALPAGQDQVDVARGCGAAAADRLQRRTAAELPLLRASALRLAHEAAR